MVYKLTTKMKIQNINVHSTIEMKKHLKTSSSKIQSPNILTYSYIVYGWKEDKDENCIDIDNVFYWKGPYKREQIHWCDVDRYGDCRDLDLLELLGICMLTLLTAFLNFAFFSCSFLASILSNSNRISFLMYSCKQSLLCLS